MGGRLIGGRSRGWDAGPGPRAEDLDEELGWWLERELRPLQMRIVAGRTLEREMRPLQNTQSLISIDSTLLTGVLTFTDADRCGANAGTGDATLTEHATPDSDRFNTPNGSFDLYR
ncbi:hypothetical protein BEP19_13010 [Ammoniphilus oxalaticus]|uniref:Uncharacterized protein n=1 Tax=Ammoniphilus oxalaticus TaxID=66863 RepID=A0A419SH87_9BACL|nr:hypothetical protein BEP19_13010 [Ammoniphilus oxalaticus]